MLRGAPARDRRLLLLLVVFGCVMFLMWMRCARLLLPLGDTLVEESGAGVAVALTVSPTLSASPFAVVEEESTVLRIRDDLGGYLEELGYKTGAELGVQDGWMAKETLQRWKSCTKYVLVDIWRQQAKNYRDAANRPNDEQHVGPASRPSLQSVHGRRSRHAHHPGHA